MLNAMARTKEDVTKLFRIVIGIVRLQGKSPKGKDNAVRDYYPIFVARGVNGDFDHASSRIILE